MMKRFVAIFILCATSVLAVEPDEILPDPELEARAREISKLVRCLVCQNENIDDSNADLARDLRLLVRERLVAGDTDAEIYEFLVDKYGEFVLLKPTVSGKNLLLWFAGPILLIFGIFLVVMFVRQHAVAPVVARPLSEDEAVRLKKLLDE